MREFILSMLAVFRVFFQSRSDTAIEVVPFDSSLPSSNEAAAPSIELFGPTVLEDAPAVHRKKSIRVEIARSVTLCNVPPWAFKSVFPILRTEL